MEREGCADLGAECPGLISVRRVGIQIQAEWVGFLEPEEGREGAAPKGL